jgi:hypothetical protein
MDARFGTIADRRLNTGQHWQLGGGVSVLRYCWVKSGSSNARDRSRIVADPTWMRSLAVPTSTEGLGWRSGLASVLDDSLATKSSFSCRHRGSLRTVRSTARPIGSEDLRPSRNAGAATERLILESPLFGFARRDGEASTRPFDTTGFEQRCGLV